jgi:hypothetical protein
MKGTSPSKGAFHFTSILEQSTNKLWGAHFRVPERIAGRLSDGDSRRVVCTLNGVAEYQCAILPLGRGVSIITVNKKLRDALHLEMGMELHVRLAQDTSEYGLPMPEELQELFRQDIEGKNLFHALARGKQRTLLYMIGSVKGTEKRVRRSIIILDHLKAYGGKINYKRLAVALKDPRRQV